MSTNGSIDATESPAIEPLLSATEADRSAIIGPLARYSTAKGFQYAVEPIVLALRQGGAIVGGLIGYTNFGWLYIEILSVHEDLRGQGCGRRLMAEAEAVARARGCVGAWVDTFTFQDHGFYQAVGYGLFGTLPNYPGPEQRLFFRKMLV